MSHVSHPKHDVQFYLNTPTTHIKISYFNENWHEWGKEFANTDDITAFSSTEAAPQLIYYYGNTLKLMSVSVKAEQQESTKGGRGRVLPLWQLSTTQLSPDLQVCAKQERAY